MRRARDRVLLSASGNVTAICFGPSLAVVGSRNGKCKTPNYCDRRKSKSLGAGNGGDESERLNKDVILAKVRIGTHPEKHVWLKSHPNIK